MECAALPRPDLSNLGTKHCTRVAFGGGGGAVTSRGTVSLVIPPPSCQQLGGKRGN